ncbi:MAG: hypothetical protein IJ480_09970 [Clostridia bacterium]|nr:hypothetical protein [Clostridia bacterium]
MNVKRAANLATAVLFSAVVGGFFLGHVLMPDGEMTTSERRRLAQFPELSAGTLESGAFMTNFEKYSLDQFPLRDSFRSLKAVCAYNLFGQKDNNDIYLVGDRSDGYLAKIEYPMKENQITGAADKCNKLKEQFLAGSDVYFAMVPDKNYFLAEDNGYLRLDYDRLRTLFYDRLDPSFQVIDIFDTLTIGDYYRTDTHWDQAKLGDTVDRIAGEMGFADRLNGDYTANTIENFYGVYSGQSALPVEPDTITYLTSDVLENCTVTNLETGETAVYNLNKLTDGTSMDKYDIFLDGPAALVTIENPAAATDRELLLFRDSFGSSIAPLFVEAYAKVTLIDLRYLASDYLEQFVEFAGQDALFLYSTTILNTSEMLKVK